MSAHDLLLDGPTLVMQDEAELAENAEVPRDVGADHREERVHGPAVQRIERHGVAKETERDERGRHVKQDRIPYVRDGDAVPDAGGTHRLPSFERRRQELPVDLRRQREALDDLPQHTRLIPPAHVMMNAAGR